MYLRADYFVMHWLRKGKSQNYCHQHHFQTQWTQVNFKGKLLKKCPIWVNKEVQAIFMDTHLHLQISIKFVLDIPHALL